MKEYIFDGDLADLRHKLRIWENPDDTFSIYWESYFLGSMYFEYIEDLRSTVWISHYEYLKPYIGVLGKFIEMSKFEEDETKE